jgi:hypothetical protein
MASFNGTIYLTTNLVNNKVYVGQTTTNDSSYIGSGRFIKKAIEKYGKSNFLKIVLLSNIASLEELNLWEMFYINLFGSRNSKIGYNSRPGGSRSRFNHTLEAIEKIKVRSGQEDNRLRIREIQKLAAIKRKGCSQSEQSKIKMIVTKFGKLKEIEIYKNGELVETCSMSTEASKITGVKSSAIRNNLSGLSKSAGGYVFKYKNID